MKKKIINHLIKKDYLKKCVIGSSRERNEKKKKNKKCIILFYFLSNYAIIKHIFK